MPAASFFDWRPLRFEPFGTPVVSKEIARIAEQMTHAIKRMKKAPKKESGVKAKDNEIESTQRLITTVTEAIKNTKPANRPRNLDIVTLVVDPMHRGDFPTINEAIKSAKSGSRILIKPGTYNEAIVIDKALELIGDGDREHIVVQIKNNYVIRFATNMGRVAKKKLSAIFLCGMKPEIGD